MDFARPEFYIGVHHEADAWKTERCMISINRLERRHSDFRVNRWMLDSGAFTRITRGVGHLPVEDYAARIRRWASCGELVAAVSQDYMCEPFALAKAKEYGFSNGTVGEHQRMTIERYDALLAMGLPVYIMPVLQGYKPEEYVSHIRQYGDRLKPAMWVGVGSVCKRNSNVKSVEAVLLAIHAERPDLRLHGFGLKLTALQSGIVCKVLRSCDSLSWSLKGRRDGSGANDIRQGLAYAERLANAPVQLQAIW